MTTEKLFTQVKKTKETSLNLVARKSAVNGKKVTEMKGHA